MPVRDALVRQALAPISHDSPAGASVRADPVFRRVKEALREEDDLPQGEWDRQRKTADLPLAVQLAGETLATRSKDLWIAAWLVEALARREGISGLRDGLVILRGLIERYWDGLYPPLEDDGSVSLRIAPLEYVARRGEALVRAAPVDAAGHTFHQFLESRRIGTEEQARSDPAKERLREEARAKGKPLPEEIDAAVAETPVGFYVELEAALAASVAEVSALDALADERCGRDAPSYRTTRDALVELAPIAERLLTSRGGVPAARPASAVSIPPDVRTPSSVDQEAGSATPAPAVTEHVGRASPDPAAAAPAGVVTSTSARPISTVEEAFASVGGAARFLRRGEPTNPIPYLLLRALRWAELHAESADGGVPAPQLLAAPATQTRTRLRSLQLDARWTELLDAAEEAMAAPEGRGWLDLQRYAATACDALGGEHARVGDAVRGSVRQLLASYPSLPDATLLDETPAASAETRAWLDAERLRGAVPEDHAAPGSAGAPAARSALDRAMGEVRASRPERAVALLVEALGSERSGRGRFLRQADIAAAMVEAGLEQVAEPILDQVVAEIDEHKLEGWEPGDVVARPLVLLYRCLERRGGDEGVRRALYLRICRLDPVAALAITPMQASA